MRGIDVQRREVALGLEWADDAVGRRRTHVSWCDCYRALRILSLRGPIGLE